MPFVADLSLAEANGEALRFFCEARLGTLAASAAGRAVELGRGGGPVHRRCGLAGSPSYHGPWSGKLQGTPGEKQ